MQDTIEQALINDVADIDMKPLGELTQHSCIGIIVAQVHLLTPVTRPNRWPGEPQRHTPMDTVRGESHDQPRAYRPPALPLQCSLVRIDDLSSGTRSHACPCYDPGDPEDGPCFELLARSSSGIPGWIMAGSHPADYLAEIPKDQHLDGKRVAVLRSRVKRPAGFGTVMQTIGADEYRGSRRFAARNRAVGRISLPAAPLASYPRRARPCWAPPDPPAAA